MQVARRDRVTWSINFWSSRMFARAAIFFRSNAVIICSCFGVRTAVCFTMCPCHASSPQLVMNAASMDGSVYRSVSMACPGADSATGSGSGSILRSVPVLVSVSVSVAGCVSGPGCSPGYVSGSGLDGTSPSLDFGGMGLTPGRGRGRCFVSANSRAVNASALFWGPGHLAFPAVKLPQASGRSLPGKVLLPAGEGVKTGRALISDRCW